jgi:hypothetical protein
MCCVRRHSILPSSHRLSVENSKVSAPEAIRSAKADAYQQDIFQKQNHENNTSTSTNHTHIFQLLCDLGGHARRSGSRGDFAAGVESSPQVLQGPRVTLRPGRRDHQAGR